MNKLLRILILWLTTLIVVNLSAQPPVHKAKCDLIKVFPISGGMAVEGELAGVYDNHIDLWARPAPGMNGSTEPVIVSLHLPDIGQVNIRKSKVTFSDIGKGALVGLLVGGGLGLLVSNSRKNAQLNSGQNKLHDSITNESLPALYGLTGLGIGAVAGLWMARTPWSVSIDGDSNKYKKARKQLEKRICP